MKYVSELFIGNGKKITIRSLEDLQKLPDKSIVVLFNNSNYIEVIYLYVLYKLDMCLENNSHNEKERRKYFNICFGIIPTLISHQNHFLSEGQFCLDQVFDHIPKEIEEVHKNCIQMISNFFAGVLSSTPYLKSELFDHEKLLFIKHNYANMLQFLDELLIFT